MTSDAAADSLAAAVERALFGVYIRVNPRPAAWLSERWEAVRPLGEAVAAQHLRNLMKAHANPLFATDLEPIGSDGRTFGLLRRGAEIIGDALALEVRRLSGGTRPPGPGFPAHVVVVMDHLPESGPFGVQSRQACAYAAAFALMPEIEKVTIFVTQEAGPEFRLYPPKEVGPAQEAGWRAELETLAGGPVPKVAFAWARREGPVYPLAASIPTMQDLAPDLMVEFIGLCGSLVTAHAFDRRVPTIAIQFGHSVPEPEYGDLILAHGWFDSFEGQPEPWRWRNHVIPVEPYRSDLPYPEERLAGAPAPRVVSALVAGRLERALMMEERRGLTFVSRFLEQRPGASWLFVGVEDPDAFGAEIDPWLEPDVRRRILLVPRTDALCGLFRNCHVYVHFPGLRGGAMGIAMAIDQGLPAIVAADTDAANFIDAGLLYRSPDEALARLLELTADEPARLAFAARQQARLAESSVAGASRTLRPLIDDALANFQRRRRPA